MEVYENIMVCVTRQKTCERLISGAYELNPAANLYVVNVIPEEGHFLNDPNEGEALEYLFETAKKFGAQITVLKSGDVLKSLADYANDNGMDCVVMGQSPTDDENSFLYRLKQRLTRASLIVR